MSSSQLQRSDKGPALSFGPVAPYYDILMAGVPYPFWLRYVQQLWQRNGLEPRTVLDLACGTGTMARLMTSRGYQVTGVDLSEGMLQAARTKAIEEDMSLEFIRQDAAELDLGSARFDTVLSMFDSLNYILDPERLESAFARVFLHLIEGGAFVFDVNTEYALAEGMFNQSCSRRGDPLHYRWRSRYNEETRLCRVHMRFTFDDGSGERQTFTEIHWQRAYHKDEIIQMLNNVGFEQVFIYDAYSINPPHKRSDRLFYFAVKGSRPPSS